VPIFALIGEPNHYDLEESEGFHYCKQIAQTLNQSTDRLPQEVKAVVMLCEIEEKMTP